MNDDRSQTIARTTIAVAGLSYVLVFLTALAGSADIESALLKAMASMLCLGILGVAAISILGAAREVRVQSPPQTVPRRLDVAISAAPDEKVGETSGANTVIGSGGEGSR